MLRFNRAVGVEEAEQYLWAGPPPVGGSITQVDGETMHVELTIEGLEKTREDVAARWAV